jgi:hypothetical protein
MVTLVLYGCILIGIPGIPFSAKLIGICLVAGNTSDCYVLSTVPLRVEKEKKKYRFTSWAQNPIGSSLMNL